MITNKYCTIGKKKLFKLNSILIGEENKKILKVIKDQLKKLKIKISFKENKKIFNILLKNKLITI